MAPVLRVALSTLNEDSPVFFHSLAVCKKQLRLTSAESERAGGTERTGGRRAGDGWGRWARATEAEDQRQRAKGRSMMGSG